MLPNEADLTSLSQFLPVHDTGTWTMLLRLPRYADGMVQNINQGVTVTKMLYHDDAMMQISPPGCLALFELLVQRGQQEKGPQRQSGKNELKEDTRCHASACKGIWKGQNDLSNLQHVLHLR